MTLIFAFSLISSMFLLFCWFEIMIRLLESKVQVSSILCVFIGCVVGALTNVSFHAFLINLIPECKPQDFLPLEIWFAVTYNFLLVIYFSAFRKKNCLT